MDILAALPQLVALIEKGGVTGLLLIACVVLVIEIRRGRRLVHEKNDELAKAYAQRDKARLALVKCKAAADAANVKVDLSDLTQLLGDET
jgi:hypothetical protein